jgi:hypothetical protein
MAAPSAAAVETRGLGPGFVEPIEAGTGPLGFGINLPRFFELGAGSNSIAKDLLVDEAGNKVDLGLTAFAGARGQVIRLLKERESPLGQCQSTAIIITLADGQGELHQLRGGLHLAIEGVGLVPSDRGERRLDAREILCLGQRECFVKHAFLLLGVASGGFRPLARPENFPSESKTDSSSR